MYILHKAERKNFDSVHQFFTIRRENLVYLSYKDGAVGETDAVEISADNPTAYP